MSYNLEYYNKKRICDKLCDAKCAMHLALFGHLWAMFVKVVSNSDLSGLLILKTSEDSYREITSNDIVFILKRIMVKVRCSDLGPDGIVVQAAIDDLLRGLPTMMSMQKCDRIILRARIEMIRSLFLVELLIKHMNSMAVHRFVSIYFMNTYSFNKFVY